MLTRESRVVGLVQVYGAVKQHFCYLDRLPGVNWDEMFAEFLPQVEKEQSTVEYYMTLRRFVNILDDAHTYIQFPKPGRPRDLLDSLPIHLKFVEGCWIVSERRPSPEILAKDIPPGSTVLQIEDEVTEAYLKHLLFHSTARPSAHRMAYRFNDGQYYRHDQVVRMLLRYPDGSKEWRSLRANNRSIRWTKDLRQKYLLPWHLSATFARRALEGNTLYVRYPACDDSTQQQFIDMVSSLQQEPPAGMIIDLRGNRGGSTPSGTISHLLTTPAHSPVAKTRCTVSFVDAYLAAVNAFIESPAQRSQAIREQVAAWVAAGILPAQYEPGWIALPDDVIEPGNPAYAGPLVLLVDTETGSAAEDFALRLQMAGRAFLIGEPTANALGQPLVIPLPGGGRLMVSTLVVDYRDGRQISGAGLRPDLAVPYTIQAAIEGRDEALTAALKHLSR